jgi:hypothetical protein
VELERRRPFTALLRHRSCGRTTLVVLRLLGTALLAAVGLAVALGVDAHNLSGSSWFFFLASVLLAIGLYAGTSSIDYAHLAENWRIVTVAITVGVLLKAGLITAVMYLAFQGEPRYLVLGVAMAQIDPLSVAALRHRSRLSERGRAILTAWSSFDDPVTTVLVILLAGLAVDAGAGGGAGVTIGALVDPVTGSLGNIVLLAAGLAVVWVLRRVPGRPPRGAEPHAGSAGWRVSAGIVLLVFVLTAAFKFWMLGLAVLGLYFRMVSPRIVERFTTGAFFGATFLLGMVLADGMAIGPGIVLGMATYGAQVVVGLAVAWRLRRDRWRLALAQQSGITAMLLALLLEPVIPGTIGVVAPAIATVAVLYITANALLDRVYRVRAERAAVSAGPA